MAENDQFIKFDLPDDFWQRIPAQPLAPGIKGESIEMTITYADPHRKARRRFRVMVNAAIRALRKGRK